MAKVAIYNEYNFLQTSNRNQMSYSLILSYLVIVDSQKLPCLTALPFTLLE